MNYNIIDKLPMINNIQKNTNFKTFNTLNLKKRSINIKKSQNCKKLTKNEIKNLLRVKNLNKNNEFIQMNENELNDKFYFINTGKRININEKNMNVKFNNTLIPNEKILEIIKNLNNNYEAENWEVYKDDLIILLEQNIEFLTNHDKFEEILKISLNLLKFGIIDQQCIFFNLICFLLKSSELIIHNFCNINKVNFFKKLFKIFEFILNKAEKFIDLIISSLIIFFNKIKNKIIFLESELVKIFFEYYLNLLDLIIQIIVDNKYIITTNNLISTKVNFSDFFMLLIIDYNSRNILLNNNQLKLAFFKIIKSINTYMIKNNFKLNYDQNFCNLDLFEIYFAYSYYFKKEVNFLNYINVLLNNKDLFSINDYLIKKLIKINKFIKLKDKNNKETLIIIKKLFYIIEDYNDIIKENKLILYFFNSIIDILEDLFFKNIKLLKNNKMNLMIFLNYINKNCSNKIKETISEKIINLLQYIN